MSASALKGENGTHTSIGTTPVNGEFDCIDCLSDTVFLSLTETNATGDSLAGVVLTAGTKLFGRFTAYTLTSGSVRAYKRGGI